MRTIRSCNLLLALLLLAAVPAPLAAGDSPGPADLELVPADCPGFIAFRLADCWNGEGAARVRKLARENKDVARALGELEKKSGLTPGVVERAVVLLPLPGSGAGPLGVVTTTRPYDPARLRGLLGPDVQEKQAAGKTYLTGGTGTALWLVNERTFVLGRAADVDRFVGRPAAKNGEVLREALVRAAEKHAVVAGLNLTVLGESIEKEVRSVPALAPLLQARSALVVLDADGERLRLEARLTFAGADAAAAGEKAANAGLDMARTQFAAEVARLDKLKPPEGEQRVLYDLMLQIHKDVHAALKTARVECKTNVVQARLSVQTPDAVTDLFIPVYLAFYLFADSKVEKPSAGGPPPPAPPGT